MRSRAARYHSLMPSEFTARFHDQLDQIDASEWDALVPDDNPFVRHAFLAGLEQHGCIRAEYGWRAHHLALYRDGRLVAGAGFSFAQRGAHELKGVPGTWQVYALASA